MTTIDLNFSTNLTNRSQALNAIANERWLEALSA